MIILLHPRTSKPKNRRFPLPILAMAAVLEGKEEYAIVDGNLDQQPERTLDQIMSESAAELLAVSVMPGPQMKAAIPLCSEFRRKYPRVPIVWGGYFASLYTDAALNAPYVDFAVRGQGEETFLDLLSALRGDRKFVAIRGLSFKDDFGLHVHNADRSLRSPNEFPWFPFIVSPHPKNTFCRVSWAAAPLCITPASAARIAANSAESSRYTTAGKKQKLRNVPPLFFRT